MSGASERANGRASGPVLLSVFLAVIVHSALRKMDIFSDWGFATLSCIGASNLEDIGRTCVITDMKLKERSLIGETMSSFTSNP